MTALEQLQVDQTDLAVRVTVHPTRALFVAFLYNDAGTICQALGESHESALRKLEIAAIQAFAPEVSPC